MARLEPLWQVTVQIPAEAEEPVSELLQRLTGQIPSVYAAAESKTCSVTVYVTRNGRPARADLASSLAALAQIGVPTESAVIQIRQLPKIDWSESWKKHFKPIILGRALLIKPSWSKRKPAPGQATLILDPGLSFGTGQHPTTRFCLEQLVHQRPAKPSMSLLDLGCGSGILALAAAKLHYRPVRACDFDPVAVRIARGNAKRNRITRNLAIRWQDVRDLSVHPKDRYDVVCANLVADLLLSESRRIIAQVAPRGLLILAGILTSQFADVAAHYLERGLIQTAAREEKEWKSAAFQRL